MPKDPIKIKTNQTMATYLNEVYNDKDLEFKGMSLLIGAEPIIHLGEFAGENRRITCDKK